MIFVVEISVKMFEFEFGLIDKGEREREREQIHNITKFVASTSNNYLR